jgi:amidase
MHDELDLTALSAVEIAARVRDGRSGAVDVTRAHLRRIAERDSVVGAFQVHDAERMLAEAGGVDARSDRFALPLAGVPVAVEDSIDVAGHPTRHGPTAAGGDPARRDDEVVKRLRSAGAVIVGKARMPELGSWGAAAAVASGMAVLAVANAGGGAGAVPAACCGLVGLTPGSGVLPGGADRLRRGLRATGPIARSAADAALLLGVLTGRPTPLDDDPGRVMLSRIALSLRNPTLLGRLHADHRAAAIGAAARLRADPGGATATLADPPHPLRLTLQWIRHRWPAMTAHRLRTAQPGAGGAEAEAWRERMIGWLDDGGYDLVLGPAAVAPLPGDPAAARRRGFPSGRLLDTVRAGHALAWTVAGLPAVVAPVLVDGRPVGVQLVGRPGSEAVLLTAAARLERRVVPAVGAAAPRCYV